MDERNSSPARGGIARRRFLGAVAAAPLVVAAGPAWACKAPSFTLAAGNYRVKVCPITGGSRLECVVEELTKSGWVPVPDVQVLVRPVSEKGAFDEETTDKTGTSKHSKYKYPTGTRVNVSVPGYISVGEGTV